MALTPGTRLGVYEVAAQIGEGGMGQVFRATDTKLKRQVAIKILPGSLATNPDRLARFQREAEVLASLNHPHIAGIYGLEESDGVSALVMEFVDGEDLSQRIARGAIPIDEALPIAKQIADALETAHEQGIVHRDLKPANIKVRPDGAVKVLDFGLAKLSGPSSAALRADTDSPTITSPAMTQAGVILGTAAYMSPEQARGQEADARGDVFSFGCVLYEMLTGQRAFKGEDVTETLAFVITKEPDWSSVPEGLPAPLRTLLARCLAKDRRKRLQAIAEARIVIDDLTAGRDVPRTAPVVIAPERRARMGWAPWAAAVLGGGAVAVAMSVMGFGGRAAPLEMPMARFTLETPPDAQFMTIGSGQMVNFALSPDGRNLVFVGQDADNTRLWLRPIGSLSARALPRTEGAIGIPFWSPDSQAVGFFATDRLRVVDLASGATRTVCATAPIYMGTFAAGAWSAQGTIVFAVQAGTRPSVVPASGGSPTALPLFAERPEGDVTFLRPQFLPDQRRFLFAARSAAAEANGVFVASLDDPRTTRVLDAESRVVYAGDHLAFVRGGVLMAQRFDHERAVLLDSPRPLGDAEFPNDTAGTLTAAGSLLVYSTGAAPRTELIAVDRTGRLLETITAPRRHFNFELSPDEKRLVIARPDENDRGGDIWSIDLARRIETRLTFGRTPSNSPVWSPDGRLIAFSRYLPAPPSVWLVPADGGPERRLREFKEASINLDDWSPDGTIITFNDSPRLMAFPPAGDAAPYPFVETKRANLDESHFSPDGKWIAYNSDESGTWQVYVSPFPATGQRWQVSTNGGAEPRWRGDGRELYYRTLASEIVAVPVTPRRPFEAGAPAVLFRPDLVPNPRTDEYAVTADGQRFILKSIPKGDRPALTVVINWSGAVR